MKISNLLTLLFFGSLVGCSEAKKTIKKLGQSEVSTVCAIPIKYDFEHLNLYLNTFKDDSIQYIKWRWNYLTSDNTMPDSNGIDYFMNISQPVFYYNREETLPTLSITTERNRIIEFSATTIFHIRDNNIANLLDSLSKYELLQEASVRKSILETGQFNRNTSQYKESLELNTMNKDYEYDRLTYTIQLIKQK